MEDILRYEETQPLSYELMRKHAPKWCTVRLYDGLKKYKSLKEAAGGNPCMIVLYELHDSTKRNKVGVGHYSLVILGAKTRYWSSYGYPVDFEISATHSKDLLKDLLGDHVNDKIDYQDREHTQTCWKWCLLRASVYKMPEPRFKALFYSSSPRLKTPDDLVSVITLGLLGPEYMAGALTKGQSGDSGGQETGESGGRLRAKRRRKGARRKIRKPKRRVKRADPYTLIRGRTPYSRSATPIQYTSPRFIESIHHRDRTLEEQDRLQMERAYIDRLYKGHSGSATPFATRIRY